MLRSASAWTLAVLLLCLAGLGWAATPKALEVGGKLFIGADGAVHRVVLDDGTHPELKAIVEKTVLRWRFEPVVRDGEPSQVRVGMKLDLEGMQADGGFRLRVTRVDFDSARIRHARVVLPQLNTTMDVLTALRLDAAGKVTDVAVVYMSGSGSHGSRRMAMTKEIERALKQSTFSPAELAYGDEADETVFLPINYRMHGGRNPPPVDPQERAKQASRIPWLAEGEQMEIPETQASGQPIAMHQADVRLSTQVVGTFL